MIDFLYIKEEDTIYTKRKGLTNIQELVDYAVRLDIECKNQNNLYIIDDATESEFEYDEIDNFKMLLDEIKKRRKKYEEIKVVLIVDNPDYTALSYIFEQQINDLCNFHLKIFSSVEAGKIWLNQSRELQYI